MKNHTIAFFLGLILAFSTLFAEVKVDIDMQTQFYETSPINGTIIVTHSSKEKIDPSNFKLNNKPLETQLKMEQPLTTGDLILSMYNFTLPPQSKGLYVLPAIFITVNGKSYRSYPRTYEVTEVPANANSPSSRNEPPPSAPPVSAPAVQASPTTDLLKLEAFIEGPHEIYPSQRTFVGIRYFYNVNVEATKEVLPLLEAEGLIKIGDKIIKEEEMGGISVQQFEQQVEGSKPGTFKYGPSVLEGYPYQLDPSGRKIVGKQLLSSTAPEVIITVLPFPEENKPISFNGALGNFNWSVELLSSPTVNVGDEIELLIEAKGKGNFDNLQLPELCCQPGMSGLFRLSDLPPVGEVVGDAKRFHLKMRPISTLAKTIPELEFSSFDPESRKYVISHSQPIPLTVTTLTQNSLEPDKESAPQLKKRSNQAVQTPDTQAEPIEIESIYPIASNDLHNLPFGIWPVLFLIPFGCAGLLFQFNMSKYLETLASQPKTITSKELFSQALQAPQDSSEEYTLFTQTFLLALAEKKLIANKDMAPEDLPKEGLTGEVRDFLSELDRRRYMGTKTSPNVNYRQTAQALFEKLENFGG